MLPVKPSSNDDSRDRYSFGLVWFYGTSTIVGYLMPNPYLYIKQFYSKQFSLAKVHSFNVKNNSILNNSILHRHTV